MRIGKFPPLSLFLLLTFLFSPQWICAEPLSIRVGAYANPPKIFQDDNGDVAGFWPELIADIAKKENWQIEYVWGSWSEGLDRLKSGEIDIFPDVAVTESRKALYEFSRETVLLSWSRLYVNEDIPAFSSIFDLSGRKIAVLKNSVNYVGPEGIRKVLRSFGINCTFIECESYAKVFQAVQNNSAYGGVSNRNFGNTYAEKYGLKQTSLLFQPANLNFAFPQQSRLTPLLISALDKNIKSLKNDPDSIYYNLLKKHFETGISKINVITFPLWAKQLLAFLGIVVIVSLVAIIIFRIKLRNSSNRYLRLTENARDMIYRMSLPDGVYEYVSPASAELFGYTPAELYTSPVLIQKAIHPDWHKYFEEQWAKLIVGDMPPSYEYQIIHKSGQTKWVHQRNVLINDNSGRPIAIEGIVTDITERKEIETTLRESKEKLNEAQRIAHIGSWDLDLIKNELYWSEEVYRMFDLEPKQTVASYESFLENIHPDDRELVNNAYTESVKNKTPYDIVHRLLLSDGSIKFVREQCETFYADSGKASRSIGTIQDITEIRQADLELEKYRNNLEALVKEQTEELEVKVKELERMNTLFVGREFRIKELRDKIVELEKNQG